jgi:hypothetical protein
VITNIFIEKKESVVIFRLLQSELFMHSEAIISPFLAVFVMKFVIFGYFCIEIYDWERGVGCECRVLCEIVGM